MTAAPPPGPGTALGRGVSDTPAEHRSHRPPMPDISVLLAGWGEVKQAEADEARAAAERAKDDELIDLRCRVHELERELAEARCCEADVERRIERAQIEERRLHVAGVRLTSILWSGR